MPSRSHTASNASASPAILLGVNGSPSQMTTSNTVTMKFRRKVDALVLTEPAARLRMKQKKPMKTKAPASEPYNAAGSSTRVWVASA
jgi:hypothetical protein